MKHEPFHTDVESNTHAEPGRIIPWYLSFVFFLGPCLILAVEMAGEGFPESLLSGYHYGFSLLWVVGLILIYKYALIEGLARYTLTTGNHIFDGLHGFPGPKNWEVYFMVLIYTLEMIAYGGIALYSGRFLHLIIPGFGEEVGALVTICAALLFLIRKSFTVFEHVMLGIAGVMIAGTTYCLLGLRGLDLDTSLLDLNFGSEFITDVSPMMLGIGSGLSLLLYSVWLKEKVGVRHGSRYLTEQIQSIRIGQGFTFILIGLLTTAFVAFGSIVPEHSELIPGLIEALHHIPHGLTVFIVTSYILLFGVLLAGADGRARAIASILHSVSDSRFPEKRLYQGVVVLFCLLMGVIPLSGSHEDILSYIYGIASLMFAIVGFMILYLDSHLPKHARGSHLWILIMSIGSAAFLLTTLFREEVNLEVHLPTIEHLMLLLFILYLFDKTGILIRGRQGALQRADQIVIITVMVLFCISGIVSDVWYGSVLSSFLILGPVIAGLFGGPVIGIITGVMSGLILDPQTAPGMSMLVGSCLAGLLSGWYSLRSKGIFSYLNLILLGIGAGLAGFAPLLLLGQVSQSTGEGHLSLTEVMVRSLIMILLGLIITLYFINEKNRSRGQVRSESPTVLHFIDSLKPDCISSIQLWRLLLGLVILLGFGLIIGSGSARNVVTPLLGRIAILACMIFVLTRSKTFQDILTGSLSLIEKSWIIVIFGIFSIFGTLGSIDLASVTINFRDLGPIIAGLLGGPVIGLGCGIVGGLYYGSTTGVSGIIGMITTMVAGLLAGYASWMWRGVLSAKRLFILGLSIEMIWFVLTWFFSSMPPEALAATGILTTLTIISGLLVFYFIIREETVSIQSMRLSGNGEEDKKREHYLAALSEELMDYIAETFTIISGRLIALEYFLETLGEQEAVIKIRAMIRTDHIDELLNDFNQFALLHGEGKTDDVRLALKAGQITQKLNRMIHHDRLDLVVDHSLISRAQRMLADYLEIFQGSDPAPVCDEVDLTSLISGILLDIRTIPVSDEEFLDVSDNPDLYAKALLSRVAHLPLFDSVTIRKEEGLASSLVCSDRDRIRDLIVIILERMTISGAETISLSVSDEEDRVLLSISSTGMTGAPWQDRRIHFLERESRICGGEGAYLHEGTKQIVQVRLPKSLHGTPLSFSV
ncbi:MAG TPA: LytS/YhcK type 5TM receptor domain-containing protein [Methanospirillum sp.]|nr:LytS/YhcK type 5TM receptor domain-containing protein [Methanospirillum sp.]